MLFEAEVGGAPPTDAVAMLRLFTTQVRDIHIRLIPKCVALIDPVTVPGMRPKNKRCWPYDEYFVIKLCTGLCFFIVL